MKIGDGASFDPAQMRNFGSGAFVRLRADQPHYATSDGGATVQIMGTGRSLSSTLDFENLLESINQRLAGSKQRNQKHPRGAGAKNRY